MIAEQHENDEEESGRSTLTRQPRFTCTEGTNNRKNTADCENPGVYGKISQLKLNNKPAEHEAIMRYCHYKTTSCDFVNRSSNDDSVSFYDNSTIYDKVQSKEVGVGVDIPLPQARNSFTQNIDSLSQQPTPFNHNKDFYGSQLNLPTLPVEAQALRVHVIDNQTKAKKLEHNLHSGYSKINRSNNATCFSPRQYSFNNVGFRIPRPQALPRLYSEKSIYDQNVAHYANEVEFQTTNVTNENLYVPNRSAGMSAPTFRIKDFYASQLSLPTSPTEAKLFQKREIKNEFKAQQNEQTAQSDRFGISTNNETARFFFRQYNASFRAARPYNVYSEKNIHDRNLANDAYVVKLSRKEINNGSPSMSNESARSNAPMGAVEDICISQQCVSPPTTKAKETLQEHDIENQLNAQQIEQTAQSGLLRLNNSSNRIFDRQHKYNIGFRAPRLNTTYSEKSIHYKNWENANYEVNLPRMEISNVSLSIPKESAKRIARTGSIEDIFVSQLRIPPPQQKSQALRVHGIKNRLKAPKILQTTYSDNSHKMSNDRTRSFPQLSKYNSRRPHDFYSGENIYEQYLAKDAFKADLQVKEMKHGFPSTQCESAGSCLHLGVFKDNNSSRLSVPTSSPKGSGFRIHDMKNQFKAQQSEPIMYSGHSRGSVNNETTPFIQHLNTYDIRFHVPPPLTSEQKIQQYVENDFYMTSSLSIPNESAGRNARSSSIKKVNFPDEQPKCLRKPHPQKSIDNTSLSSPKKLACISNPPKKFTANVQKTIREKGQVAQKSKLESATTSHEVFCFREQPLCENYKDYKQINVAKWVQDHYGGGVVEHPNPSEKCIPPVPPPRCDSLLKKNNKY